MNEKVDLYLEEGCGRCKLHNTPECKLHTWARELRLLRELVLSTGLFEDLKWSMPCYTHNGKNVVMIAAFKEYCCLSFFKGFLLADDQKILTTSGENSQTFKILKITSLEEILKLKDQIRSYVFEAIEIEKSGLKIEKKPQELVLPEELKEKLESDETLKIAFKKLTPGRQRSHVLFISQAKQTKTRESRVEKCIPLILSGKGQND